MERHVCIHGHFYQPPRENPWLEALEIQDSAHPYHDWNERLTAECYAPNTASRILDGQGRIIDIVSNYSRISFDFGPTLLSWMEKHSPETYRAVLLADRQSRERRSGHGNAIAQVYNHIIMPLANPRDKRTQVIWGIKDFEARFKRFPEGMWLAETAVDMETLEILAEQGIKFSLLAPRQAWKVRKIGSGKWKDVDGSRIDPTRAYLCNLPSGRRINLFFYDGPISQAVAFEELLKNGEGFAERLLSGLSDGRDWPQLMNIATDGETYGHHHRFGDMALAQALKRIESGAERLTNYGEYLEKHPPSHEVRIFENSSWSCMHGIERWRSNCGCNSGSHGWSQEWRLPLREALDWLRDQLTFLFEGMARDYLKDPWAARDNYISVILDRSDAGVNAFLERQVVRELTREERVTVLKLMEIQRHALLMYTSCGWFFDELSGLETVQVIRYAGRALQLSEDLFEAGLEDAFKLRLSRAKSNLPEHQNGSVIYDKFVKPSMIDLKKVGAHYAVSSLFESFPEKTDVFSYEVTREDFHTLSAGGMKLAIGKTLVRSAITGESGPISFAVLHLGGHVLNGGVRAFLGASAYGAMKREITEGFERGDFAEIVRLMDAHFGMHNYSLTNLFRDRQREVLDLIIQKTVEEFEDSYRRIYENNRILMGFLREIDSPVQKAFISAAEFTISLDLVKAFSAETLDADRIQDLIEDSRRWGTGLDKLNIEFAARRKLESLMSALYTAPLTGELFQETQKAMELVKLLPLEINYWQVQNIFFRLAKEAYPKISAKARAGDEEARELVAAFKYIGDMLFFNMAAVLQEG